MISVIVCRPNGGAFFRKLQCASNMCDDYLSKDCCRVCVPVEPKRRQAVK